VLDNVRRTHVCAADLLHQVELLSGPGFPGEASRNPSISNEYVYELSRSQHDTMTSRPLAVASTWRTPIVVLIAGCLIAMVGFGIRSTFGLFLDPMTTAKAWSRETFGLAMAIQNLMWGIGLPGFALHLTGGLLTGIGIAFTAFSLALAAMVRVVGAEKRSLTLGLGTAAGSAGQVVFSPLGQGFITAFGWNTALLILAAITLVMIPLALALPNDPTARGELHSDQTIGEAVREAVGHRGYVLLTVGFFVCGFHVAFITVHFPAYVKDVGLDPYIGAYAIALVGLFNIVGSFLSGMAGQRWSKKFGLSLIYFSRAVAITALLLMPKTELTIYLFAAVMGILWLSTVPLTTGIVAQVFGVRYMATLFGIVFFSHQLGSFLGVWLGGRIFDETGSYDGMWWGGVILGLAAAVVHLPINEKPLSRLRPDSV
jgi:predicted MFS family arabinose efflux permease